MTCLLYTSWRDLKLIVKPSVESPTLTEEQLELIKGYKEKYGLDLNQFIGVLKCNVEIRYPEGDIGTFYDEETRSFEGKSVITLSDKMCIRDSYYLKRRILFLAFLSFCVILQAQREEKRISGHVRDSQDLPLAGVNIKVKNTPYGAISNEKGEYV